MFGFIKKILKREDPEDYDDLRSHVLSDKYSYGPALETPQEFTPKTAEVFAPFSPSTTTEPAFQPLSDRPFERPFDRPEKSRDYDILDRLNLIESQLAAIRSQTETINERLKNIDARLGQRRY